MPSQDAIRWRLLRDHIRNQTRELREESLEPSGDDWKSARQLMERLDAQAP